MNSEMEDFLAHEHFHKNRLKDVVKVEIDEDNAKVVHSIDGAPIMFTDRLPLGRTLFVIKDEGKVDQ